MGSRTWVGFLPVCCLLAGFQVTAQTPGGKTANPGKPFTLHTGTHIVLTDVTVTDAQGQIVHGLDRSMFRILDEGQPQQLTSFEEHTGTAARNTPAARHSGAVDHDAADHDAVNNDFLAHPPAASNLVFIDTTNIGLPDQAYVADQLTQFIEELEPGEPLAICSRGGLVVLVQQDFTTDRGLLLAAVHRAVPLAPQTDAQYSSDPEALRQLGAFLKDVPGRKNVLWFTGGSHLDLLPDASALPVMVNMRPVYDALEGSRIAVYPIDTHGLAVERNRSRVWQHLRMADAAEATGGKAFYNENGLARIAARVLGSDRDFYTLTYAPHDLHFDNRWHKVRIEAGSYRLSYRHGYYDDGTNLKGPGEKGRTLLQAGGQSMQLPADRNDPLIFQATLEPFAGPQGDEVVSADDDSEVPPPKKGEYPYSVHFTLPSKAFVQHLVDGQPQAIAGMAIYLVNDSGRPVGRLFRLVTLSIDAQKLRDHPEGSLAFSQQINLPKGQDYLQIVLWDTATGRHGTLHVPIQVRTVPL
ncbi:MAG: VWA domain-containing protein [Janthinobacterium lividum]